MVTAQTEPAPVSGSFQTAAMWATSSPKDYTVSAVVHLETRTWFFDGFDLKPRLVGVAQELGAGNEHHDEVHGVRHAGSVVLLGESVDLLPQRLRVSA